MRNLLTIFLAASLLVSCHSTRQVVTTPPVGDGQQTTTSTTTTVPAAWTTMQTGGNVTINAGKKLSSGMQMRMVRDQVIYISLRPLLGIEVGRLIVRADSVFAIDKLHKRYVAEDVSLITGGVPLTVGMLQDAFLGREFKADLGSRFSCDFSHDAAGQVSSLNVHYNGRSQATYQVNYADVKYTLGGPVAHEVSIATQIKGKDLMLDLSYNNIAWNSQLKVDTTIPKGYTRIDGKQLFSIFEQ